MQALALYSANLDGSDATEILDLNTIGSRFFLDPIGIATNGTNLFWTDQDPSMHCIVPI